MATGAQLPISIVARKSKSALGQRTIVSKFAPSTTTADAVKDAETGTQTPPSPAEAYVRRTGNVILSMEEKLASYRNLKEAAEQARTTDGRKKSTRSTASTSTKKTATTPKRSGSSKTIVPSSNQSRLSFGNVESPTLCLTTSTKSEESSPAQSQDVSSQNDISALTPPQSDDFMGETAPNGSEGDDSSPMPPPRYDDVVQEQRRLELLRQDEITIIENKQGTTELRLRSHLRSHRLEVASSTGNESQSTTAREDSKPDHIPNKRLIATIATSTTATESESAEQQSLPTHLNTLYTIFNGLESVLTFLNGQKRLCFYHKSKKQVELQCGRNFELKHLAQFITVMPEAYRLTAAPCLVGETRMRSILIQTVDLEDESSGPYRTQPDRRKELFRERLMDHVKQEHEAFLRTTKSKGKDLPPGQWHTEFDLEQVSEIKESTLPEFKAPSVDIRDYGLKKDVPMSPATSLTSQRSSLASPVTTLNSNLVATSTSTAATTGGASRALDSLAAITARIRQKQLDLKKIRGEQPTVEEKHRGLIAARLPSVFDVIRFRRIDVMAVSDLTEKIVKSSRQPISEQEGRESLEMMVEILPEWCTIFSLADGIPYFKVLKVNSEGKPVLHNERELRARLVDSGR
ncbi:hypothetical protein BGZ83_009137 [Gryganskiella cystojenkinii]|nr:hypothetical protein BGZ83_009137 [Gryganskiella cystojenkinii]